MCISASPSKMSDTILYANETIIDNKLFHIMGYQNQAKNLSNAPNCMILPIPSATQLGPENILNTENCKDILKDYSKIIEQMFARRSNSNRDGLTKGVSFSRSFQVFDSGEYTIVLASSNFPIEEALMQVKENKRPKVSQDMVDFMFEKYPNNHLAICCFDGSIKSDPIIIKYEPMDKSKMFLPALDAHDGNIPADVNVNVDHMIIYGSSILELQGKENKYCVAKYNGNIPANMQQIFNRNIAGEKFEGRYKNGDFYIDLYDPRASVIQRISPFTKQEVSDDEVKAFRDMMKGLGY